MPPSNNNNNSNNNNINSNSNKKKTYRSHHSDYRPFLRYIENHAGIDDATAQRLQSKFGTLDQKNSSRNKNIMPSLANSNSNNSFASQMTKAERDDARHADLHTNVKHSDLDDSDRIFLLKREIDNLKGTIEEQQQGQSSSSSSSLSSSGLRGSSSSSSSTLPVLSNIPLLSVLLFFGVVLVSARFLSRKLKMLRASESLLSEAFPTASSSSPYEGTMGFELQEQQQSQSQSGLFASIASSLEGRTSSNVGAGAGASYEAPPGNASSASLRFV